MSGRYERVAAEDDEGIENSEGDVRPRSAAASSANGSSSPQVRSPTTATTQAPTRSSGSQGWSLTGASLTGVLASTWTTIRDSFSGAPDPTATQTPAVSGNLRD